MPRERCCHLSRHQPITRNPTENPGFAIVSEMASLEQGRKFLEHNGTASALFSCLIVTGTVMLHLFSPPIA